MCNARTESMGGIASGVMLKEKSIGSCGIFTIEVKTLR